MTGLTSLPRPWTSYSPPWVVIGIQYLGLREVPGKDTCPAIERWLRELGVWWRDDETPWCGVFTAWCMREAGFAPPSKWYRALSWKDWGSHLSEPLHGSVAVMHRPGGGHVFFAVGENENGDILGLGGNQANQVSIAPFPRDRISAHRAPPGSAHLLGALPKLAGTLMADVKLTDEGLA